MKSPAKNPARRARRTRRVRRTVKKTKDSSEESRGDDIQRRSLTGSATAESRQNPAGSSDAIHDAELAIQKDDGLAEAHLALGFALLAERKDYDRAMEDRKS